MTIADEIERLEELRRNGTLSEEEFQKAKAVTLQGGSSPQAALYTGGTDLIQGMQQDTWCMLMHLSQLLTFSGLGVAVPIIMWAISKDESAKADRHGIDIINWLLSSLLYGVVFGILCFIFIGFPLLIALGFAMVIFPIIGALKANQGIRWEYPMSIAFLKPRTQNDSP